MVTATYSRRIFLRGALGLILACISAGADAADFHWREFQPPGGRFVMEMPGEPTLHTKIEETPVGSIDTYRYIWERDGTTFAAGYADLPSLIAMFGGRDRIYNKVKDVFLKRTHMSEIAYTNFKQDAYTGMALTFGNKGTFGKLHMLLVSRRVYVMVAQIPMGMTGRSPIEPYLASFKPIYRKVHQMHHKRR